MATRLHSGKIFYLFGNLSWGYLVFLWMCCWCCKRVYHPLNAKYKTTLSHSRLTPSLSLSLSLAFLFILNFLSFFTLYLILWQCICLSLCHCLSFANPTAFPNSFFLNSTLIFKLKNFLSSILKTCEKLKFDFKCLNSKIQSILGYQAINSHQLNESLTLYM